MNDLTAFAAQVTRACQAMPPAGRFCESKVFIHTAYHLGRFPMERPEFERLLWAAHQAGLVTLSRADMVEAMDAYDVRRSNMRVMNATFNFIKIGD